MAQVYFEVAYKSFTCDCGKDWEFLTAVAGVPEAMTCSACGRAWKWVTPALVTEMQPEADGFRCVECGEPAAKPNVVCDKCMERKREANRREYERLRAIFEPARK